MASSTKPGMPPKVRVQLYRMGRKWTQAQAAKWWGCSEREWRRWEKGDATPPPALLMRIAKFKVAD